MTTSPIKKEISSYSSRRDLQDYSQLGAEFLSESKFQGTSKRSINSIYTDYFKVKKSKIHPLNVFKNTKRTPAENIVQEFSGLVTEYDENNECFTAKIKDRSDKLDKEEIAEIFIEQVSDGDLKMIKPGAEFSWYITRTKYKGRTSLVSTIKFRRFSTPLITKKQIDAKVNELVEFFSVDKL